MIILTHTTCTDRRGSTALETAVALSAALVFICSIVSIIVFHRAEILMQRSVVQACEEMSLVSPLQIPAGDAASTLINLFPDKKLGDFKGSEVLKKIGSVLIGVDSYSDNAIENLILENTMAHTIANKIRSGYIARNNNSDFYVPDMIDVDLNIDRDHHVMEVECNYSIVTLAGNFRRTIYQTVPMYGKFELFLYSGSNREEDDIWSKDNFTRGDYFLEQQGANLPKTFPVINSFQGGIAKSIVSVDLTAPTYRSETRIKRLLASEIDDLAGFTGADVFIDGRRYTVNGRDIRKKVLTVIIPSNSPQNAKETAESMKNYASLHNITLNIVEYGNSKRYE